MDDLQLRYDELTRDINNHTDDIEYLEQLQRDIRHLRTQVYEDAVTRNDKAFIDALLEHVNPMFTINRKIDTYYTRHPMMVTYNSISYTINEYPLDGEVVEISEVGIFATMYGYIRNDYLDTFDLQLKMNSHSDIITSVKFKTTYGLQHWLYISNPNIDGTQVLKYGYNQQIMLSVFNNQSNMVYLRLNVPSSGLTGDNTVLFLLKQVSFRNENTSDVLEDFPPLKLIQIQSDEIFRTLNNLENESIIGIVEITNSPSVPQTASHTGKMAASEQRKIKIDAAVKKIMDLTRDIKADDGHTWLVPKEGISEELKVRSAKVSDTVYYTRGKLISRSGKLFAHWDSDIIERGAILTVAYAERYSRTKIIRYYFQGLDIKSDHIVADLTQYTDFFELPNAFGSSLPGTVFLNISDNKAVLAIPGIGDAEPFEKNKWRTDDVLQTNHPSLGRLTKIPIEHLK